MLTAILMNPAAIKFLEAAARLGTGPISAQAWQIAGQIAVRSLGTREESGGEKPQSTLSPSALKQIEQEKLMAAEKRVRLR
jgi:hypothetical protein